LENGPYTQEVILSALNITSYVFAISQSLLLLFCIILLLFSGLISGAEVAFFSLTSSQFKHLREGKSISVKSALKLIGKPKELIATIFVTNNFINISIVILSANLFNYWFGAVFMSWWGFLIEVAIIALIILLFGEMLPKISANQNAMMFIRITAIPLYILNKLFKPVTCFLIQSTGIVEKQYQKKQPLSMDDLSDTLDLTSETLTDENEILKGIIEFGNIEVSEIMCPRVDVMTVETSEAFTQILDKITQAQYSRIPVYTGTFDNIAGILYIKDLLAHIHKGDDFRWQSLIRPPYFVPEKKKINDLLEELQLQKIHMAIVVDEYGGTSGIITMEDIIEVIVGDITDEFDDEEANFTLLSDHVYLFKAKTQLTEFTDLLGLDTDYFNDIKGESESLAGLILEMKGELPKKGELFTYNNLTFIVEEVDHRRIISIRVKIENT
jgi:putative hemolysin